MENKKDKYHQCVSEEFPRFISIEDRGIFSNKLNIILGVKTDVISLKDIHIKRIVKEQLHLFIINNLVPITFNLN